jgi:predicted nucleotidyltransferase
MQDVIKLIRLIDGVSQTYKEVTTMSLDELLRTRREDILRTATRYGAFNVRVFGSVARGEADAESDIDLLVDMEPGRSLLDLSGLLIDLEDLLGCNVDVITERGLRDRIRERVLREAIAL